MKTINLIPNCFKIIGWIIFLPTILLALAFLLWNFDFGIIKIPVLYNDGFLFNNNSRGFFKIFNVEWFPNLLSILVIISGFFVGFSKEKIEDEYISHLRLKSILWSLKWSYLIVLLLLISIFGMVFFKIMIVAIYLPLILYIFRFNYLLIKNEK